MAQAADGASSEAAVPADGQTSAAPATAPGGMGAYGMWTTTIDKSGRVLIPVAMKEGAGITSSSVVVTGANDRLKVWEPSVWAELERQADEEDLEARVFEKYQL